MSSILIHFAGYWLINLLMPEWADEAAYLFLAYWYAAFALIDLIALNFCFNRWVKVPLIFSCAWSMSIILEMAFVQDDLQRHDWIVQNLLDSCFAIVFLYIAESRIAKHFVKKQGKGLKA